MRFVHGHTALKHTVPRSAELPLRKDKVAVDVNADGEEKVLSAFFRAPSPIMSVRCAGDKISVGCESGAVLTLHAAWLTDRGAASSVS